MPTDTPTTRESIAHWPITDLDGATLYEILNSRRRRMLLTHIADRGAPFDLDELVEAVAFVEVDGFVDVDDLEESARMTVRESLLQTHLPWLTENDLVEWPVKELIRPTSTGRDAAIIITGMGRLKGYGGPGTVTHVGANNEEAPGR